MSNTNPKLVILGCEGMLGSMVMRYFAEQGIPHIALNRTKFDAGKDSVEELFDNLKCPAGTYVVNCIGVVNRRVNQIPYSTVIRINSLFPHELADTCQKRNLRLIHVSTDCVFSGAEGGYSESSNQFASDLYGMSKLLGEPVKQAMVIRSSFIGPEIRNHYLLVSWVLAQEGKMIPGFTNHLWNGVTSLQFAKVVHRVMDQNLYQPGLFHVFSPETVSKASLVSMIARAFGRNVNVNPVKAPAALDRHLKSEKELCAKLAIPSLENQIRETAKVFCELQL